MNSSDSNPGPLFDYRVALCGPDEARLSDIVPADPVEDSKLISLYLKELFSSLARKESDPAKGLTRASFDTYMGLPGMLGDRLFAVFCGPKEPRLNMENFVAGMERLLTPGFEAKLHLVFALLDSDRDDLVSKEEISRALSHVPLNESLAGYESRKAAMAQILSTLDSCLGTKPGLNFAEFEILTESRCSDIFLSVYALIRRVPLFNQLRWHLSSGTKFAESKRLAAPRHLSLLQPLTTIIAARDRSAEIAVCEHGCDASACEGCKGGRGGEEFAGYLYLNRGNAQLERRWFRLAGKELYSYVNKTEKRFERMYELTYVAVIEEPDMDTGPLTQRRFTLHPLTLCFPVQTLTLFAIKAAERLGWLRALSRVLGHVVLSDLYDVKECVGKGGFAKVRLARRLDTNEMVALKIMKKRDMTIRDLQLYFNEVQALTICRHPHVVDMHRVFETAECLYMEMEYLEGRDLLTRLGSSGKTAHDEKETETRARAILRTILEALSHVHGLGFVHRDIKPENVIFVSAREDSEVKVADFNLAVALAPKEKYGSYAGSKPYAAPEVRLGFPHDRAADLWSLGVVAYLLLCGRMPYSSLVGLDVHKAFTPSSTKGYSLADEEISASAKDFISKLMMSNPTKRMTAAEALTHAWIVDT